MLSQRIYAHAWPVALKMHQLLQTIVLLTLESSHENLGQVLKKCVYRYCIHLFSVNRCVHAAGQWSDYFILEAQAFLM